MFVGPTSQAPRIDEARNDQVYELEIAFKQVPEGRRLPALARGPHLPGYSGRCDRQHAPGRVLHRQALRAGIGAGADWDLLEMRAFEMPPHSRMSLTQHLLLRSLIARFWNQPYRQKPGALAHRDSRPLHAAAFRAAGPWTMFWRDLNEGGYPSRSEWFAPHFEFRFPLYGSIEQRGIELELRQAIEPWNVLGEEPGPGGTVRYVDSSVERCRCW
jgi:uncharacterized protein (DUF2126 family)